MELTSKDYSWAWVTESRQVTSHACELVYAYLVPSATTTDTVLYNGRNAQGGVIAILKAAVVTGHKFDPKIPAYCEKGLYVSLSSNASGVFVQYRSL